MKKILFALAVLFGCATVSFSQNNLVATLQHEGTFTHYYGNYALKWAYDIATDGDTITLSPGTFESTGDFIKGITLRGAGVQTAIPTKISGDFYLNSTEVDRIITIEGILFDSQVRVYNDARGNGQGKIKFIKDILKGGFGAYSASSEKGPEVRIYNSSLWNFYIERNTYPDIIVYNSGVYQPVSNFGTTTSTFINCDIHNPNYQAQYQNFYNCLFWNDGSWSTLPNTAVCYNCLSVDMSGLFQDILTGENNMYATGSEIWKDGVVNGELTEEAQKKYLGLDGTQVGHYGGCYPFTWKVQYPIITTFSSDVQTSKQGILNINVEVDEE